MSGIVNRDILHAIFSSTTELLDFQRRFLIALEATLSLGPNEHRIGAVFVQNVPNCTPHAPASTNRLSHESKMHLMSM